LAAASRALDLYYYYSSYYSTSTNKNLSVKVSKSELDWIVGKEQGQPAPAYGTAYSTITVISAFLTITLIITSPTSSSFEHAFLFPSLSVSMMPKGM
jgi:hypothetical protein